ncbi:MAG: protein kinase [Verrucomicrobia bacterium]|nr:protein kinase [Verrucomicrobiota bacterium]
MTESSFYKQTTMPDLITGEAVPLLPSVVGPYKIEGFLSKGGMSLLYLGLDPETRRPLAIKVLSPSYVTHPEAVSRFMTEARVIGLTNHPNIVKLYGQGEWEGGLYIAMELIHGISLKQFIMQHSLSMRRALEIILQVAYALLHLHAHGVIHRDLKPENILINEEGEVKVIDFGIAQVHEEPSIPDDATRLIGTPNYMSPEQKQDPTSVTFSSDIYTLGIILYELFLGKLSYGVIQLTSLPKGVKKIAEKMLAISIKERYLDISDVIHDISQYLNSGELEREQTGSDQIKEIHETLQRANLTLSPLSVPNWPQVEIGISKTRGMQQLGLYYDFFRLPSNTYLIFLACTPTSTIESPISIATLKGMVRMHVHELATTFKAAFKPREFISKLNQILAEEGGSGQFVCSLLYLDPLRDQLTYINCGLDSLLHVPDGQNRPRMLTSQNALVGASLASTFSETTDNWNSGDILILHTLTAPPKSSLDELLSDATADSLLLSAPRQAEGILKRASLSPLFNELPYPKALFSIQRIL